MNFKNFIIGGIVGGIVDFLLGWLFYGIIFSSFMPENADMNLGLIACGCFTFAFLLTYIFMKWPGMNNLGAGIKEGAILGLFFGLMANFFHFADIGAIDSTLFLVDIIINIAIGAIVGGVIAMLLGKLNKAE
jgi:hypothetical protein